MMAAGSAVGLGNVWRFPFVAGRNGGAAFVIVYLAFLAILGFPLLVAELAVGRGAKSTLADAMRKLSPAKYSKTWGRAGAILASGCFVLMIYYTDVAGWLLGYTVDYARAAPPADPGAAFAAMTADAPRCTVFMLAAVGLAAAACAAGVAKGVERATKAMMIGLLLIVGALAARSLALPGAKEGLAFYLKPDWASFMQHPGRAVFEAMGQAFFTLSLGIGSMTVCGSYIGKEHSLAKESVLIIAIDTAVALLAGAVVFPACATYGIDYSSGPGLVFETLPKVFSMMPGGVFWGFLFFLFLSFAALTTVIAVFECLVAGIADFTGLPRRASVATVAAGVAALSMPCILFDGVLAAEDFAVSQVWLPAGALAISFFVSSDRFGWGWKRFREEASAGRGWPLPDRLRPLYRFAIPVLMAAIFILGL